MKQSTRKRVESLRLAASRYAAMGWPVCPGAQPHVRMPQQRSGRACSCDRIGCPAPGAHPLSPAWKLQATTDPQVVRQWWGESPQANILLVTGRSFDVLDVPAAAGRLAIRRLDEFNISPGPVAATTSDRTLFFVGTRALGDDDEWWSCHLDCEPEVLPEITGLRWHCKDSYVVAPPSRLSNGLQARWLAEPGTRPLPDALRLLELLADACEEIAK